MNISFWLIFPLNFEIQRISQRYSYLYVAQYKKYSNLTAVLNVRIGFGKVQLNVLKSAGTRQDNERRGLYFRTFAYCEYRAFGNLNALEDLGAWLDDPPAEHARDVTP